MSITKSDIITHEFFLGFIRLHILYHASQGPVFGLDLMRELAGFSRGRVDDLQSDRVGSE